MFHHVFHHLELSGSRIYPFCQGLSFKKGVLFYVHFRQFLLLVLHEGFGLLLGRFANLAQITGCFGKFQLVLFDLSGSAWAIRFFADLDEFVQQFAVFVQHRLLEC